MVAFGTAIIWMRGEAMHFEILAEDRSGKTLSVSQVTIDTWFSFGKPSQGGEIMDLNITTGINRHEC